MMVGRKMNYGLMRHFYDRDCDTLVPSTFTDLQQGNSGIYNDSVGLMHLKLFLHSSPRIIIVL
jgi:hypothetical protein